MRRRRRSCWAGSEAPDLVTLPSPLARPQGTTWVRRTADYRWLVAPPRYRCGACGNLTRFDVTTTRTTRAFHHYSVGGELNVEEERVLDEHVDEVSCRWCGHGRAVEMVSESDPRPEDPVDANPSALSPER